MRTIFLEKSYPKCGGETISRPFPEKSLDDCWEYLWINSLVFYTVRFYCMLIWGLLNIVKPTCTPLAFTLYKAFLKKQRGLELVSFTHFLHYFARTVFLLIHSINWPNSITWFSLTGKILSNMCIAIVCCDVINFQINLIFLIKLFYNRT